MHNKGPKCPLNSFKLKIEQTKYHHHCQLHNNDNSLIKMYGIKNVENDLFLISHYTKILHIFNKN